MTDAPHLGSEEAASTPATSPVGIPAIGVAPLAPTPARPQPELATALLVDSAPRRQRRTEDLVSMMIAALGITSLLVLAIYAHETTTGVTEDVHNAFAVVLRRVLVFPLQAIEGLVSFLVPVVVFGDRLLRRRWHRAISAALAAVGGFIAAALAITLISTWAPETLRAGLTVTASGSPELSISATLAALSGILTAAGERRSSTVVRAGWLAFWVATGMALVRNALNLPGAFISLLLGRLVGLALRYAVGMEDQRAKGLSLVRALRRAGVDAERIVRMDHAPNARAWSVTTESTTGYTERVRENPLAIPLSDAELDGKTSPTSPTPAPSSQPATKPGPEQDVSITPMDIDLEPILTDASSKALTEGRPSVHRLYAAWDRAGIRRNVTILDADRQVAGFLSTAWDRLRVRGLAPERDLSVRTAAEHAALMTLEARRANVRTPNLLGMAEVDESVLLVTDHIVGARTFADLDHVSDAILDDLWTQLRRAHEAGLAHRSIESANVVVDVTGRVWLLDWDSGEIISSELSRRLDLAQALALVACVTDVERAIASASRALTTAQVASIAPMLQRVVLPRSTREALGKRTTLQDLRDALVALTPTAHAEPAKITRFSARTVAMAVVGVAALWTLLARMNFAEVSAAVADANFWWVAAALIFSLATYLGAGQTLVAFCPVRLSLWRSTEVHLASSVVSLVAPAGVGGAAINLRFLNRKGVPTAVGVATVALVQVIQFLVTVVLLVVLAATTGRSTGLSLPSGWLLAGSGVLVLAASVVLLVPSLRNWVWVKIEPTYKQVWPRLVWVMSNPRRLALGIGGAVLLSLSYILAFGASLWAFGYTLPFSVLAITYLASNTVGSVVPSPGGIGPVELALTAGLVTAGIPSGVALSAAIVYRLVTFWVPIPVGWLSLQRLQKTGEL
ncbi:3-deoxy-D-manno-octulosonic-acid kinase [Actinomyces bovis]|uniref:3-deoxy-D-manno-octulosonic-acid kinase n=1 Tax=Actinomyces bovis TaxID=1658 RepID=A0ABY1VQM6_9ACTO|nr:lysylphosphatidylglycerol synthase transmembrane domain-containing protein [Actinomyces bovis]SPT54435.1 3-deoxy-D-manno-octulosonic-acid kinase [Actinomyces bovis]VEG55968.1 3-deoxy-D-manno-octulosonic-acid kinase [Actinomyces israelii]